MNTMRIYLLLLSLLSLPAYATVYDLQATFTGATITGVIQDTPIGWDLEVDWVDPLRQDRSFHPGGGCLIPDEIHCYGGTITATRVDLERYGLGSNLGSWMLTLRRSGSNITDGYFQATISFQAGDFVSGSMVATDLPALPASFTVAGVPEPGTLLAMVIGMVVAGLLFLRRSHHDQL